MAKKKDTDDDASQASSPSHHKKHKHKKHKKHKKKRLHSTADSPKYGMATSETVSSDSIVSMGKPALKLKIKFGGQTSFETKNVDRLTIPPSSSEEEEEEEDMPQEEEDSEDDTFTWQDDQTPPASLNQSVASSEKDEEEAWLDALEAGELDDYGESKKQKDPATLTARQRALLHGTTEEERQLTQLPNLSSRPATEVMTSEMLEKKAQKAQKRRVQAKKKVEENKKQTIERLLKKQDFKNKGNKARNKRQFNLPCVSYINSINGISLSYPAGRQFPLAKAVAHPPKPRPTCGVTGCSNPNLYSCSKTGVPLCSLACYKKNLTSTTVSCAS